jgi:hypothetical protein
MSRRILAAGLLLAALASCAGPTRLAEKSAQRLDGGDMWRAWQLATRALDRQPLNPHAQAAAQAAAQAIAGDWQRRIHALATVDSVQAAEQVLAFDGFRVRAANYTTLAMPVAWAADERALRRAAARRSYQQGREAMSARRPKLAFERFRDSERFESPWRDAARLADVAYEQALTRVAVLPVTCAWDDASAGRSVADHWRDAVMHELAPPHSRFTRVLGPDGIDARMSVAQLAHLPREDAVRLGRRVGAQRVVIGSMGPVSDETQVLFFREHIARRVVQKNSAGETVVRWIELPVEVVARVRDVSVQVDHEVLSTRDGSTLAHQRTPLHTQARVVWTSYVPEGALDQYALVSETLRAADPERAKAIEMRWKAACGEGTTLQQVLGASREARGSRDTRGVLGRFAVGAAFVFLQELPSAQELAQLAAEAAWQPLLADLARLDGVDDVDLGVTLGSDER